MRGKTIGRGRRRPCWWAEHPGAAKFRRGGERIKVVRWSPHALASLADREIDRREVERTLASPETVVPGQPGRKVFMRRYFDGVLRQEMLLRAVVEETSEETIVVTVYKTSQIGKYLKGLVP